ncbi:membrane protein [Pseudonocardia sulfidoxydans NBRC 16205]|uniref:Membrane protein n=1 Tax=Pseudonocardia sulfidoxydans NBRC 16205 TaxID=1223511 RepID=A0A511DL56_9PSEU|nr:phosphatase PAP2 family protein [Pseudonocardia sulfidoxydans]GEL24514.1 membrane protein [Pseudonocardia sulfidoxydans NBRC 16205]
MPARRHLLVVAAVCGVGAAVMAVAVAGTSVPTATDAAVSGRVDAHEPMPYAVAQALDVVGTAPVATALAVVVAAACLFARHRRGAALALAGPALAVATTSGLKPVVGRTIHGENLAFPSGHTAVATAIVVTAALAVAGAARLRAPAALAVVLTVAVIGGGAMALGQVTLMAHYPSDTLGGLAIAFCVVVLAGEVVDLVADGRARRRHRDFPTERNGAAGPGE